RGCLREGGRSGSSWWREIVRIRDGTGDIGGGRFGECVSIKVGNGFDTFFWTDPWLDGTPWSERFRRLFDLTENKSSTVVEMFSLGWEPEGRRGCGRDSCGCERMRCWGSVRLYFTISFCRPRIPMCGSGSLILFEVTLFVVHISAFDFSAACYFGCS
ncbi:cysteine-rich receptor-like protein kinase, partial [Trifolium medium]|nr:cysteine-rich receptor-like protein kinase [Trifolium medium]